MFVYFPNLRDSTRTGLVSRARFEADCAARLGIPVESARTLVTAIVTWLHGVMRRAVLDKRDVRSAVEAVAPPTVDELLGPDRTVGADAADDIVAAVVSTTLRELPYWGMSRLQRANERFRDVYSRHPSPSPSKHTPRRVGFLLPTAKKKSPSGRRGALHQYEAVQMEQHGGTVVRTSLQVQG